MASHHAAPGEIVNLSTWSNDLASEKSKIITKTKGLELARLVIEAGFDMHHSDYCSVKGATIFQCLSGYVKLKTPHKEISIRPGQLVYLEAEEDHALIGIEKSVVLLTIRL